MQYTNHDARTKFAQALSPAFRRRLQRIRDASRSARSLAEKKRMFRRE